MVICPVLALDLVKVRNGSETPFLRFGRFDIHTGVGGLVESTAFNRLATVIIMVQDRLQFHGSRLHRYHWLGSIVTEGESSKIYYNNLRYFGKGFRVVGSETTK
jgi:hypothetical protein